VRRILRLPANTLRDVRAKESLWLRPCRTDPSWRRGAWPCLLWCARWFWPSDSRAPSPAELRALIDSILHGDRTHSASIISAVACETSAVAATSRLFHWPLEFPDVFESTAGGTRGRVRRRDRQSSLGDAAARGGRRRYDSSPRRRPLCPRIGSLSVMRSEDTSISTNRFSSVRAEAG
jgi:hypothetical protein